MLTALLIATTAAPLAALVWWLTRGRRPRPEDHPWK